MKSNDNNSAKFDVHISFRFIRYSEDELYFELQRDPAGVVGEPALVYVPNAQRWLAEMPEWARGRREEIIQLIRNRCSHMKDEWQDY